MLLAIKSLKMSDDKKRKFGLTDLKFGFYGGGAILVIVSTILMNFEVRYHRIEPFDVKGFILHSIFIALILLAFYTLISYAHYRAEIKREEEKRPK